MINRKKNIPQCNGEKGFTVVELMVSTLVFSVILVGAMAGVVLMGRTYYKGITEVRLQETNRAIHAEVTQGIQFTSRSVNTSGMTAAVSGDSGFFCIGPQRYSYVLDRKLSNDDGQAHTLWTDIPDTDCSNVSASPVDLAVAVPCASGCSGGRELLGENMRITSIALTETPIDSGLWQFDLKLAYGDDDQLELDAGRTICTPNQVASEFCALSELTTNVYRRLGN